MATLLSRITELGGKRVPILRWSFVRMMLGMKTLTKEWQVGDGREKDVLRHVLDNAKAGDVNSVIAAIDNFAYHHKFLINVGDEKGAILDKVIEREKPKRALELGAYVGYSALRIAKKLPAGGHLYSIEFNAENAAIARRIVEHAGMTDRVTFVVGYLGDEGKTLATLREKHGFDAGSLDVVFVDHDKEAYLPDLMRLLGTGWLHKGSVIVADNVGFPGAPAYRAYMQAEEGKRFMTTSHETHLEYQSMIRDVVLESTLLG
ncbi:MAG: class I SAM-dependent methyltransferase [Myxococcales bacterium]